MKQKTRSPGDVSRQLDLLKTREDDLRAKRIGILKKELDGAQRKVRALQKALRQLGDRDALAAAGKIRWDDIFAQLGKTFSAREMEELTGASPNLVGSIVFRWKQQGRIVGTGRRGEYRKKG